MSLITRLSRSAVVVAGLACLLAGCGADTASEPSVATLQSAPAPAASGPADQRPVFPLDATDDEKKSATKRWADCMVEHGGPQHRDIADELIMKGGIAADDAKTRAALQACLPEQPETYGEHQQRTDLTAFKDNQREWYACAEAAGYELTPPDPDTGQFGLTEVGPEGDFGSPAMRECERKAFED